MKSEKAKVLSGKECEVMNYLPYFKEPPIDTIKRYKTIKKYAFICHDKDYNEKGVLESPHWHIYLNFGRASVRFDIVAKWFCVETRYVNKVKRTSSLLDYLTHSNENDKYKHQYSKDEVTANFDFVKEAEIEKTFGDFTKYSYAQQIEYVHGLPADKQLKYFRELKSRWELECAYRSLQHDRNIDVVFIYGKGGAGKTTKAKRLMKDLDYDYCISSSSNDPFQDYKGQWGVILDDIRDSWFSFSNILKILDNHTASSIIGRYNNKVFDGKIIVLTSSVPPRYWYKSPMRENGKLVSVRPEDLNQFYRRIGCYIEMTKTTITIFNDGLDELGRGKGLGVEMPNDISELENKQKEKKTDFVAIFEKMCGKNNSSTPFDIEQLKIEVNSHKVDENKKNNK